VEIPSNSITPRGEFLLFKVDSSVSGGRPAEEKTGKEKKQEDEPICCRSCSLPVTSKEQKTSHTNSHTHTFFNPAGIVYELGLFKKAPGCLIASDPSLEFTWFAGYHWSLGICRRCNSHLGWYYSKGESSFYGLILKNLIRPYNS
jgi:hypothetical protein